MAGLVPAIPILSGVALQASGITGTRPVMTDGGEPMRNANSGSSDRAVVHDGLTLHRTAKQKGRAVRVQRGLFYRELFLSADELALALAVGHRLVGDASVMVAIGQARDRAGAAEAELGLRRVAHGPAAHGLAQVH